MIYLNEFTRKSVERYSNTADLYNVVDVVVLGCVVDKVAELAEAHGVEGARGRLGREGQTQLHSQHHQHPCPHGSLQIQNQLSHFHVVSTKNI